MATSLRFPIPLSFSPPKPKSPSLSTLSVCRNASFRIVRCLSDSIATSNGEIKKLEESGVYTSQYEGTNIDFVGEDYIVKKLSAKEVTQLVKGERKMPLIVGFYATWCGPCVQMARDLEMLAVEYLETALVVKVDTDQEYEFARDMQVRGLPTVYFISPDPEKNAIRTEGLVPTSMYREIIDNEM